jgi:4-hydroxythreonine-4-phosphate dehydrogenase
VVQNEKVVQNTYLCILAKIKSMDLPKIGISIGDINGIGPEIIIKTFMEQKLLSYCVPVIYGSSKVMSYHKNIVGEDFEFVPIRSAEKVIPAKVNIVNCWNEVVNISLGKVSEEGGQYALKALEMAVGELKAGFIDALITAPISKEAMTMAGFPFPGHTEYITREMGAGDSMMLMVSDTLRIGLVTSHIPLKQVAETLSKELLMKKIQLFQETLRVDFDKDRPTIAVLGLNPHAGENGLLGEEEERIIRPAIIECKKKGIVVNGPFPADGFFGSGQYNRYDGILAMYHDQGLIPFKALSFGAGTNFTAGLSRIRTSPDHGTAFDIAGKNEADPSSFRQTLFTTLDIIRHRKEYHDNRANPLRKREKPNETDEDQIIEE